MAAFELSGIQPVLLMVGLAILLAVLYAVWLNARQALFMVGCVSGLMLLLATFRQVGGSTTTATQRAWLASLPP